MTKHVILIGFKHVGKSVVGRALARQLKRPFIDLDCAIEQYFQKTHAEALTCRQIMQHKGEVFFRDLEQHVLKTALLPPIAVLALGGGTIINTHLQPLLNTAHIIHLSAPPTCVFKRIMATGVPAFFDEHFTPLENFHRLWVAREKIYQDLSTDCVLNDTDIASSVTKILHLLKKTS